MVTTSSDMSHIVRHHAPLSNAARSPDCRLGYGWLPAPALFVAQFVRGLSVAGRVPEVRVVGPGLDVVGDGGLRVWPSQGLV